MTAIPISFLLSPFFSLSENTKKLRRITVYAHTWWSNDSALCPYNKLQFQDLSYQYTPYSQFYCIMFPWQYYNHLIHRRTYITLIKIPSSISRAIRIADATVLPQVAVNSQWQAMCHTNSEFPVHGTCSVSVVYANEIRRIWYNWQKIATLRINNYKIQHSYSTPVI
jgi:hypothetical protein